MSDPLKSPLKSSDVERIGAQTVYQGYGSVDAITLRHKLYAGGWSPPVTRELFKSGDAVVVLPYDPVSDQVVMVEQFRISAYDRGLNPWMMECIAGRIDKGETPQAVAIREAEEEAGCAIDNLIKIGEMFASPGIFAEYVTIFCAKTNTQNIQGIYGLDAEHEDIRAIALDFDDALAALEEGRFITAPVFICFHWLARHREALKKQWAVEAPAHTG